MALHIKKQLSYHQIVQ